VLVLTTLPSVDGLQLSASPRSKALILRARLANFLAAWTLAKSMKGIVGANSSRAPARNQNWHNLNLSLRARMRITKASPTTHAPHRTRYKKRASAVNKRHTVSDNLNAVYVPSDSRGSLLHERASLRRGQAMARNGPHISSAAPRLGVVDMCT
jgi:hypothetical protein